ncbi:MAG: DUF2341 domain-containing protein [Planctomycetes bacterium]|nr:DUF2341 domain-containing protein [Planctomycetota bacterium]MCW8136276.1 DUF2341 domain-containing protein [Planctomycetota bacterium]
MHRVRTALLLAAVLGAASLAAQQTHFRNITVDNTGTAVSDHQVLVTLNAGDYTNIASPTGADIRFIDFNNDFGSGNDLEYFIESYDNTGTSRIWVLLPSVAAGPGAGTFRMEYGDGTLSAASSFDNTFPPASRLITTAGVALTNAMLANRSWIQIQHACTISTATREVLNIQARRVIISASITGDGAGNLGGAATANGAPSGAGGGGGSSTSGGGGGGHGNTGGNGGFRGTDTPGAGGIVVGDETDLTIHMGSGGGGSTGNTGGNGGGAVNVRGFRVTVSGNISVIGLPGTNGNSDKPGGGSGGGILIGGFDVEVSSTLTANGGTGQSGGAGNRDGGGGGAGGRIKIVHENTLSNTATLSVTGGAGGTNSGGGTNALDGGAGTTHAPATPTAGIIDEVTTTLGAETAFVPVTSLVIDNQPGGGTGGVAWDTADQPVVEVHGASGIIGTFTGQVTATLNDPGSTGGVLSGTTSVACVAGVATFTNLSVNLIGNYTLTFAVGSVTEDSNSFNIAVGPAAALTVDTQPTSSNGGEAFPQQPVVRIRDAGGNVRTGDSTTNITVSIATGTGSPLATLSGTPTVQVSAGVATFTGLSIDVAELNYRLTFTDGTRTVNSDLFDVNVGAPVALEIVVQPADGNTNVILSPDIEVSAVDLGGNIVVGHNLDLDVALSGGNPSAVLGGTVSGVTGTTTAVFDDLTVDLPGTAYQLTFTVNSGTSLTAAVSNTFNITIVVGSLTVETQPGGAITGGVAFPQQPKVAVRDSGGFIITSDNTTMITVSVSAGNPSAILSGTASVQVSAGEATFAGLSIDLADTGYELSFTNGTLSVDSNPFDVAIGPAAALTVETQPGGAITGGVAFPQQPVVALRDAGGNVLSGDNTTVIGVAIAPGTGTTGAALSGTPNATVAAGIATFSGLSINLAGTNYQLRFSAGSLNVDSGQFDVSVGTAVALAVTVQPSSTTGGAVITPAVQVSAHDAGGNVVTGHALDLDVALGNAGSATLGGTVSNVTGNGTVSFSDLSVNLVGTGYFLHFTDNSGTPLPQVDSASFDITVGPAFRLVMSQEPGDGFGGEALTPSPVVHIVDAGGNLVDVTGTDVIAAITAGTGTTGAAIVAGATATSANGIVTFTGIAINLAGTDYRLDFNEDVASPTLQGVTSDVFDVAVGNAVALAVTVQPAGGTAGVVLTPAIGVSAVDLGGNIVVGQALDLDVTLSGGTTGAILGGTVAGVTGTGTAVFSDLEIDLPGTGYVLTFSDNLASAFLDVASDPFNIAGSPVAIRVAQQPAGALAGAPFVVQPWVEVIDAGGSRVTSDNGTTITFSLHASSPTGNLSGATADTVDGLAMFTDLEIDSAGIGFIITFAATGLGTDDSNAFDVSGPAAALQIVTQPGAASAPGATLSTQPVIRIVDAGGILVSSNSTTSVLVSITPGTGTAGAALGGATSVQAVNGVVTFTNLSVSLAGTGYTLTFSEDVGTPTLTAVVSAAFDVAGGGGGGGKKKKSSDDDKCSTSGSGSGLALAVAIAAMAALAYRRRRLA